ncbi:GTPase Era [Afifella marina]|uniref:GTPase Era n=1 Tax=Afifella marina DSM 2698 TaxID=1120955 RepID=A0A1G5MZJ4_AFIMA|nr:GTPase Era [Afifella marina]MBK1622237.1 GTPase Era [Afifella marina DSM 2698]MBK1628362.1 GTPase Era [Afifella marina]MBK5919021.1 GTPase Era [Afifella marina]RAI20239.1 GTPase Era [Afifella marina DSM 2698]SCZ30595.1 GTP-binding protein Era [Afifella marina DSM 2698]
MAVTTELESPASSESEERTRAGFVALIGAPNAGKSTLLNQLVGTKVAIVTHKVQTTRSVIRGIAMHEGAQIVFVDTPGIFAPKKRLEKAMVSTAWAQVADADITAVLIDARVGLDEAALGIIDRLGESGAREDKRVLILNKIDLVRRDALLAITAEVNARLPFSRTFMVSAANGDGVSDLLGFFSEAMPEGPYLYPEDQVSDLPIRAIAAEVTREKLMLRLHQEVPYSATVETESWEEKRDGSVRISQVIFVERESHRKILLGKGGETIKQISIAARRELHHMLERKVHLFLFVKVREGWTDDPERYREMGLEFPK